MAINGAGRTVSWEMGGEAPAPTELVPGVCTVPIDADIQSYNDGTKLVVSDFIVAARELSLGNRYGRPTFSAWVKYFLRITDEELFHKLKYIVSGTGKQKYHYLLDTQSVYDIVTNADLSPVSPRQLLVTRKVLDLCNDEDLGLLAQSDIEELDVQRRQLEDDGWDVTETKLDGLSPFQRSFDELTRIIVVAGTVVIRAGVEGFLEHSSHTNSSMTFQPGTYVEGFAPSEGVTMLVCTIDRIAKNESIRTAR